MNIEADLGDGYILYDDQGGSWVVAKRNIPDDPDKDVQYINRKYHTSLEAALNRAIGLRLQEQTINTLEELLRRHNEIADELQDTLNKVKKDG